MTKRCPESPNDEMQDQLMKKIAFLLEHTGIGGGHNVVFEHAVRMNRRGNEVFMVTRDPVFKGHVDWHPEAVDLNWITYDAARTLHFDLAIATFWKTANLLHRVNARRYCFFVQSIETRFYHETEYNYRRFVEAVYLLPVHYITQAEWIQKYLRENYGHESYLVHNGVRKDPYAPAGDAFKERNEGRLRVLIEGPFEFYFKNIDKTITLCRRAGVDEIWLLTSSKIGQVAGVDRVFSRVPVWETPKIYRSCDVLVKLSYVEGMFGPPLEMFHCGGTAIVYDVTGHEEYIRDDVNALVVEKNDEERVVSCLNALKADPDLLKRLKRGALETASRWPDWETQSMKFEEALSHIAGSETQGLVSSALLARMSAYFEESYKQVAGIKFDYRYAELFIDTGMGFNEKQTRVRPVDGDETEIAFELNPNESVKELRFDPINDFCSLHLEGIFLERPDGSVYEAGDFSTNAVHREQGELVFSTGDPQIHVPLFGEKFKKATFRLRYIAIGKEAMGHLGTAHSRIVGGLSGKLQERIVEIYRMKSELEKSHQDAADLMRQAARLEQERLRATHTLDALRASTSWKVTGPLRKARRYRLKILDRICRQTDASYRRILQSGLFDPVFYAEQRGDQDAIGGYPLLHYVRHGASEGRMPHPLLDPAFYAERNPDVATLKINPLVHYITRGAEEKKDPHPLFDTATRGGLEGRDPHPLFDAAYYRKQIRDPMGIDENPLIHFLKVGWKKGLRPHRLFDPEYYIRENADVAAAGTNPLVHYVTRGGIEKRNPHPLFHALFYLEQIRQDPEALHNTLVHYIEIRKKASICPHPLFDTAFYLSRNPDVARTGADPLEHFIRYGLKEGRCTHKYFDGAYYLKHYPDVMESKENPLVHYLETGVREGRHACGIWERLTMQPHISLVMPVFNPDPKHLEICLESVVVQIYPNWELCVADDGSTNPEIREILSGYAAKEPRIKTVFLPQNQGISAASNEGIRMAGGEYIGFIDHDDVLSMDALMEVVEAVNLHGADMIYSDEKIISADGFYIDAVFKPDFSPDLLLSHHYITHLLVVQKALLETVGYFRSECDGAQDYDLVLRLSEAAKKIHHIPKMLYKWRASETSTSADPETKADAHASGKTALKMALARRNIQGEVLSGNQRFFYRVVRKIDERPLVSVIIPFRDNNVHLEKCLDAIFGKTRYEPFEIIGVNNGSRNPETVDLIRRFQSTEPRIRFADCDIAFNYSRLNNFGVSLASGTHVVLMNDDVEVLNFDWIEALLEHSRQESVGAVGGKLYYPDGSIQHAGIVIGIKGFAGQPHRGSPGDAHGYYNRLMCIRNVSAVTGALMMVKKRLYQEAGGLDADNLSVALNDVDLCLKLMTKGLRNVWTPFCEATHHESASRGYESDPEKEVRFNREINYFKTKWNVLLEKGDPFYNPNLTLEKEDVSPQISVP